MHIDMENAVTETIDDDHTHIEFVSPRLRQAGHKINVVCITNPLWDLYWFQFSIVSLTSIISAARGRGPDSSSGDEVVTNGVTLDLDHSQ
eukprot:SAG11_NODE_11159_length_780_cov_0.860499_2_plen_90_part_00